MHLLALAAPQPSKRKRLNSLPATAAKVSKDSALNELAEIVLLKLLAPPSARRDRTRKSLKPLRGSALYALVEIELEELKEQVLLKVHIAESTAAYSFAAESRVVAHHVCQHHVMSLAS